MTEPTELPKGRREEIFPKSRGAFWLCLARIRASPKEGKRGTWNSSTGHDRGLTSPFGFELADNGLDNLSRADECRTGQDGITHQPLTSQHQQTARLRDGRLCSVILGVKTTGSTHSPGKRPPPKMGDLGEYRVYMCILLGKRTVCPLAAQRMQDSARRQ